MEFIRSERVQDLETVVKSLIDVQIEQQEKVSLNRFVSQSLFFL
jgi:hypothetical protein